MTATPPTADDRTVRLRWRVHTTAPQGATWAAFSDTDRFNRLAGLGLRFEQQPKPDGSVARTGRTRHLGLLLTWREDPVRYDAPHSFRIERTYDNGPVSRTASTLHLTVDETGTAIAMETELWPRRGFLRALVEVDARATLQPRLARALRAVVAALDKGQPVPDAAPPPLGKEARRRLDTAAALVQPPALADFLHGFLIDAPLAQQDRMHPMALARHWRRPLPEVVLACLDGVRSGLLALRWELLCPSCKLPNATSAALTLRPGHVHCTSCQIAYDASFPDSVAVVFRPAPAIRAFELPIDCLSSPGRTPHLIAQAPLNPGDDVAWQVSLLPGHYALRTVPPTETASLLVAESRPDTHPIGDLSLVLSTAGLQPAILRATSGRVTLRLRSKLALPVQLLVERRWQAPDVMTAGELFEIPGVTDRLPPEALAPDVAAQVLRGTVLAVHVLRGGLAAQAAVESLLASSEPRSLQVANGTIVASWAEPATPLALAGRLQGALFLSSAMAVGPMVELQEGRRRVPAGGLAYQATEKAQQAEPGEVVLLGGFDADPDLQAALEARADRILLHPRTATLVALAASPAAKKLRPANTRELDTSPDARIEFIDRDGPVLQLPPTGSEPGPGDLVAGRFRLAEALGRGGFGTVFAARDETSGVDAVVKLLHGDIASQPAQVQRFYNEGRLTARLHHPHCVQVLDYGHAADGRLYLAMERLHGDELAQVLAREGSLDPVRAMRLAIQALQGLHEAHRQGRVHRDVKPANLFVCAAGQAGESLKVIDFGIAVDTTGQTIQPTEHGTVGTPLYMSPEQVRGGAIDGRSDVYALGIVLYQSLSGRLPFEDNSTVALLVARVTEAPVPLVDRCKQPLPPGLADLVMRALNVGVEARYPDAEAMRQALQRAMDASGDAEGWRANRVKWREDGHVVGEGAAPSSAGQVSEDGAYTVVMTERIPTGS